MLPHLGKCRRETPSASDEISSLGERRVIGIHLNIPCDQPLVLSLPNQGIIIANPVGISRSDRSAPRRYNFSFSTSMVTQSFLVFGGIFSRMMIRKSMSTQNLGITSRSNVGHTSGSGVISQTIGTLFSRTLGTLGATTSGPLMATGGGFCGIGSRGS